MAVAKLLRTLGFRGGVGASSPATGSTPALPPKLGGYSYGEMMQDLSLPTYQVSSLKCSLERSGW